MDYKKRFFYISFILFAVLYIAFFTKSWSSISGNIYRDDDNAYLGYVLSIANNFDLDFSNHELEIYKWVDTETGNMRIGHPIGTSLLLIPVYLLFKPLVLLISYLRGVPFNEKDPLFFAAMCSAVVGYFFIGSIYLRKALRYFFDEFISDLAVIITIWGTILTVYVFRRPIFTHVPEFMLISVLLYLLAKCYKNRVITIRDSIMFGVISGATFITRFGNVHIIIFMIFAIYYLIRIRTCKIMGFIKNTFIFEGVYLLPLFLVFILTQGLVWKYMFGGWFAWPIKWVKEYENMGSGPVLSIAGSGLFFIWFFLRNFIHILVGLDWGLLYTMPSFMIGIIIFVFTSPFKFFEKKVYQYFVNSLIVSVPFIMVLRWGFGGEFYGYRYLLSLLPFSAFGAALCLERSFQYWRRVGILVCILICIFNFFIILPFELTEATTLHPDNISPLGHKGWGNNAYIINSVKFYFTNDKKTLVSAFIRGYLGAYIFGALSMAGVDLGRYSEKLRDYFTLDEYKKWIALLYPMFVFLFILGIHRWFLRKNFYD